jgi:SAM-dependent methyltransferase
MPPAAAADASTSSDFGRPPALSDRAWFDRISGAYAPDTPAHGSLCGYPSAELQVNTVGLAGAAALSQAFQFWLDVRDACRASGLVLGPSTRILDFGCGWGRIARFFFRDTRPENVMGIDVDPELVGICRRIMSGGTYEVVAPEPPTRLMSDSLDLVVAYSVFSHLAEHVAHAWMGEFARLLKPGGVVAVTTRSRSFLERCESIARRSRTPRGWLSRLLLRRKPAIAHYRNALARMFPDFDAARARYDAGEYLYAALGGGGVRDPTFYGEALIPEAYARRAWAPQLSFREFRSDPGRHEMALIILQKAPSQGRSEPAEPVSA